MDDLGFNLLNRIQWNEVGVGGVVGGILGVHHSIQGCIVLTHLVTMTSESLQQNTNH